MGKLDEPGMARFVLTTGAEYGRPNALVPGLKGARGKNDGQ
jgi:hypothetical protein